MQCTSCLCYARFVFVIFIAMYKPTLYDNSLSPIFVCFNPPLGSLSTKYSNVFQRRDLTHSFMLSSNGFLTTQKITGELLNIH